MLKKSLLIISIITVIFGNFPKVKAETKEELERQLQQIEQQISQYEKELSVTRTERQSLESKLKELKTQQQKINLQIRSTTLEIQNLESSIGQTSEAISQTSLKISQTSEQMADIILELYEKDQASLIEMIVADGSISAVFAEIDRFESLNKELSIKLQETRNLKADLEKQYVVFEDQQDQAQNLLNIQALQREQLTGRVNEQASLVSTTKGREDQYQAMLADSIRRAGEIRSRIYDLLGVKQNITFGEAVSIAQSVEALTGVRTAFLLAVLTQESNLGKNVGTCNRPGDPPEKGWRVVMKPSRDHTPFLEITSELGLNPDTTPVSCPMRDRRGNQIGWGGAMGPAQFIPSTWKAHKHEVAAITGKPANPWDIRDAFVAAAVLLKANGAAANGENGEWAAAMRYFSGSTNMRFRFYGDNVMNLTHRYQAEIEAISR